MTRDAQVLPIVAALDRATVALIRQSARITASDEVAIRDGFAECADAGVSAEWLEELVLQSYLFAGFPRALNAAREWRRSAAAGSDAAPAATDTSVGGLPPGESYAAVHDWRERGEGTCNTVYGESYAPLRRNIRSLHVALDDWMIVEGYGKVLSRPGLDLKRRELCIVSACAAAGQDRQLHSHLRGALNAGASHEEIAGALAVLSGIVDPSHLERSVLLWARVAGK
jgi:4-carboxymuconolactone decarboxylase